MIKLTYTLIGILAFTFLNAQDIITIEAKDQDISDNLDLEAVASIFGDSKDLEDFEQRLNDPESRISNLDLNADGYVDYLRVIETANNNAHLITIQAVLDKDLYQDVATIDVEKDSKNNTRVQVIGDVYMYGPDYIIEPVYVSVPPVYLWFWSPRWYIWVTPWHYGYYPPYWVRWNPYSYYDYYTHVHTHYIHAHHTYQYVNVRRSNACLAMQNETRRNDYERKAPERTFSTRQSDVKNKYELDERRNIKPAAKPVKIDAVPATGKEVRKDWKPKSEKVDKPKDVKDKKIVVPKDIDAPKKDRDKPVTKPSSKDKPSKVKPTKERSKPVYKQPKKTTRDSDKKVSRSKTKKVKKTKVQKPKAPQKKSSRKSTKDSGDRKK